MVMLLAAAIHVARNQEACLSLEVTVLPGLLLCCCLSDPQQPTLQASQMVIDFGRCLSHTLARASILGKRGRTGTLRTTS